MRVVGRSVHEDEEFLIAVQPDGTRTLLPAWMLRPESANLVVADGFPRFPLTVLATLRREIEAVLSLPPGSTNPEDNDETRAQTTSIRPVRQLAGDGGGQSPALGEPNRGDPAAGEAPAGNRAGGNDSGEGGERR